MGREVELFPKTYRVVGVVSNALREGSMDKSTPCIYFHYLQPPMYSFLFDLDSMHLIARVEERPADQLIKIKSAVEALDPGIRIEWIRPMGDMLAESVARPRFWTILATCLGLFAIAFSTVALYSMMSYSVSQRVPELSVRLALGATPAQIRQLVMKGAIGIVGKGLLAGTVLSLLVSQLFVDLVFGAQPLQLGVWASCAAALGVCALVAAYLPARRGSQTEPAACLRAR